MLIPQAIVQASGGLSQSYVGYNTVGGSVETLTLDRVYAKKITLARDGLLTSIEAHVRTNTADHAEGLQAYVFSDTAGDPDLIIGASPSQRLEYYLSKSNATNGSFRWLAIPYCQWLTAGSYWISIQGIAATSGAIDIHYDATGSDRIMTPTFDGAADWNGLYSPTTTANAYSIRAALLS